MPKYRITAKTPQPYRGAFREVGDVIELENNPAHEIRLGILAPVAPAAKKGRKGGRGTSKLTDTVIHVDDPEEAADDTTAPEGDQEI